MHAWMEEIMDEQTEGWVLNYDDNDNCVLMIMALMTGRKQVMTVVFLLIITTMEMMTMIIHDSMNNDAIMIYDTWVPIQATLTT